MIFLSPIVNPPLVSEVWTDVSKWRKCRDLNSPSPLAPANKKSESTCVAVPGTLRRLSCIPVPNPWFITRRSVGGCKWKIRKATFRHILHSDVARGPRSLGLCPVEKGTPLLTAPVSLGAQGLLLSVKESTAEVHHFHAVYPSTQLIRTHGTVTWLKVSLCSEESLEACYLDMGFHTITAALCPVPPRHTVPIEPIGGTYNTMVPIGITAIGITVAYPFGNLFLT